MSKEDVIEFYPQGVCSQAMVVKIQDGIIKDAKIFGGCMGNTQGVAILSKNRPVKEVIELLEGIQCGDKGTSCPDQFAKGLKEYLKQKETQKITQ